MGTTHKLLPAVATVTAIVITFFSVLSLVQGVYTLIAFRHLVGPSAMTDNMLAIDAVPLLRPGLLWGVVAGAFWWAALALRSPYQQKHEK